MNNSGHPMHGLKDYIQDDENGIYLVLNSTAYKIGPCKRYTRSLYKKGPKNPDQAPSQLFFCKVNEYDDSYEMCLESYPNNRVHKHFTQLISKQKAIEIYDLMSPHCSQIILQGTCFGN